MSKHFVKRVGKTIHDIDDKPILLQGVGIGGWLLFEGYMFKSFKEIDRQTRFKNLVIESTSEAFYQGFIQKWYRLFFSKEDLALIKSLGFNSIRIPLDYQFLFSPSEHKSSLDIINENFTLLDQIITACSDYGLYIILDMHAAPGGQTGTNIDNSVDDTPRLFQHELYQEQLINCWRFIADRYKDEPYIAMYDLLNEPLPKWNSMYNHLLMPLYKRIIKEIRQVDKNHMITIEGLHWSTDWSCFTSLIDDNIVLQFHKYWSNPDVESLQDYLELREQLNVPIFMGEGGENNKEWYYTVFKLYQQHDISYNFWTYKKMNTHNSIISFKEPNGWQDFLQGSLKVDDAIKVLTELLDNFSFKQCKVNIDVANHILQHNDLTIPAYGFDHLGSGISSNSTAQHKTSFRQSDQIQIVNLKDLVVEPDFKQYGGEQYTLENTLKVKLCPNEWVIYSFTLTNQNQYQIDIKAKGKYKAYLNDVEMKTPHVFSNALNHPNSYQIKVIGITDLDLFTIRIKQTN